MRFKFLLVILLVAVNAGAQLLQQPLIPPHAISVNVVLFGHSWVVRMKGSQPWAFPNIPSTHISVQGFSGYTCEQLLGKVSTSIPASTDAVFIMAGLNDVIYGVPVSKHMACMESMIGQLISENTHMLVLVSNVAPLCINTLAQYGDQRSTIAAYNQAYTSLPQLYPNNVQVVDMWTPMVDRNGWGLSNMFVDGQHPGTNGQDLVMGTIRDALYSGLAR